MLNGIPINYYIMLCAVLFIIGVVGVMARRNAIIVFMCIELMLNAVNISFIAFSKFTANVDGQIMVFFVMTIAAAEAAVGLALAVTIFKRFKEINIKFFEHLRG